jgi:hypothetical protein
VRQLRKWTLAEDLKLLRFDGVPHHLVVLGRHLLEFSIEVLCHRISTIIDCLLRSFMLSLNIHILLFGLHCFSLDIRL